MRYRDLIEAASDPLPRKFWLVFDIPTGKFQKNKDERLRDIAKGELHGVRGISASREIMTNWFMMCRNAAVVMDPSAVAAINDVQKVHYDDPDWLCRDNFAALYRVWDKEGDSPFRHDALMMNLANYVIYALKVKGDPRIGYAVHQMDYYGAQTKFAKLWQENHANEHIMSVADAAKLFEKYFAIIREESFRWVADEEIGHIDWNGAVRKALERVGKIYSDEAEWIVTSPVFHIPPRSVLLVGVDMEVARNFEAWKENPSAFLASNWAFEKYEELIRTIEQLGLKNRYELRFVDGRKFENLRVDVTVRRRNAAKSG